MKKQFLIEGASCSTCVKKVVSTLSRHIKVKYVHGDFEKYLVMIEYEGVTEDVLNAAINPLGYKLVEYNRNNIRNSLVFIAGVLLLLFVSNIMYSNFGLSELSSEIGLVAVFTFGILTSFHCIGMCGGIALSRSKSESNIENFKNSLMYNSGRILTYGFIGGMLGLFGGVINITSDVRGVLFFVIAVVMLMIGLNNLGLMSRLKLPKGKMINLKNKLPKGSFYVGVMNGFMPCGPLQTMQLIALSTMGFLEGFTFMLVFGLGTSVLLMIMGNLFVVIPPKYKISILKTSGVIVVVMALMIFNQGLASFGISSSSYLKSNLEVVPAKELPYAEIVDGYQIVRMHVKGYYDLDEVKVKKDIPVRLIFDVEKITPCIDTITIPRYDIIEGLQIGTQEVVFTPTVSEDMVITCWMNMVTTTLEVE